MGVPCWVDVTHLMHMSCNSNARFLNQDVAVTSPQPQPIDDIAGAQAAPWDDSAPRAVQVVFRHGAIDLMPLLCRNRQERRCNPPFSPRLHSKYSQRQGLHRAAESRRRHANEHPLVKVTSIDVAKSHLALSLVAHPSLRSVELCCFERSETLQARPLITAWSPMKLGSNRTHLS